MNNLDNYVKLSNDIIKNYQIKKRNFPVLQNINDIIKFIDSLNKDINDNKTKLQNNIINSILNKNNNLNKKNINNQINENKIENNKQNKEEVNLNEENIKDNLNNSEMLKYNPDDDKYENFDIFTLKEENAFETENYIYYLFILPDRRILTNQGAGYDNWSNRKYKIFVYNPGNNFKCDFSYDSGQISNIYQIDDNIIILKESSNIKIIKLKNNSLDIIQEIEDNKNKIIKLENSIISGGHDYDSKDIIFYLYEDYKLNKKKNKILFE